MTEEDNGLGMFPECNRSALIGDFWNTAFTAFTIFDTIQYDTTLYLTWALRLANQLVYR